MKVKKMENQSCVNCKIETIDPALSMHCWECFNKRFEYVGE
jgi:hypothetical protein